jgi:hypothetical protein
MPPGIPLPFIRRDASWAPGSVGEAPRGLLTGHVRGHLIELTDRIVPTLPEGDADLLTHRDWIAREVLADEVDTGGHHLHGCRVGDQHPEMLNTRYLRLLLEVAPLARGADPVGDRPAPSVSSSRSSASSAARPSREMWRAASSSMAQRLWLTTSTLCPSGSRTNAP